ncbi:kinesin motor domain-containing protein [Lentinula lateritia]|uniref:Kinesin motor domain-containing protein n=1 Tax=Lentinula lateritia TaxID=40482 RepID=A0ABQ8VRA7_9AGAR|nr:kinesin motor domain-containing protein [Lentinula lateritia]
MTLLFPKHCTGSIDAAEVFSQIHALSLLLIANSKDEDQDETVRPEEYPLELDHECILASERVEEARSRYDILKEIEFSHFDTLNFALPFYAYALGNPCECLDHLKKVPDVTHVQNHIPLPVTLRHRRNRMKNIYCRYQRRSRLGNNGNYPQHMLTRHVPRKALSYRSSKGPRNICGVLSPSHNRENLTNINFRPDSHLESDSFWTWLEDYSSCSVYWPSNFRTSHRSTTSLIYLRALVLRHGAKTPEPAPVGTGRKSPQWRNTARSVIQQYRAILNVSTSLPKAGERNHKVEDFTEQCVAVWEASGDVGEYGGWFLDVRWCAMRLTFNSSTIQRHLTRLLYVSGDNLLGGRTFNLYVQIISKIHQASTASGNTGEELEHEADTDQSWVQSSVFVARMLCRIVSSTSASVSTGRAKLIINDLREAETFIEKAKRQLNVSCRELCRSMDLAEGIWLTVMAIKQHNSDTRPSNFAKAHALSLRSIDTFSTASANYHIALSEVLHEQNLENATLHVATAAESEPSEIRYWHVIGLLSAKMEQWEAAHRALQTGTALGEVSDFAQNAEDLTNTQSTTKLSVPSQGTAKVNDHPPRAIEGLPPSDPSHSICQILSPSNKEDVPPMYAPGSNTTSSSQTQSLPPSSELLQAVADHPEPSSHEKFEYALQLRMTQVAALEYVEGAEGAAKKLLKVFQWIAEKRGMNGDQTHGKSNMVDLAGSENIRRSGAENKRATEAGMVKQSLLTLGRVINALVYKTQHIPYRESKLTGILQDSLGGRTKISIIATISPARSNLEETLSTLDYAMSAKDYIAEIERLKADVLGAREKNGILFSEETLAQMDTDRELRETENDEAKKKVEIIENQMRVVREEFEQSIGLLMKRDAELNDTKQRSDVTEADLSERKEELRAVKVPLEEETVIRRAHQQSEITLDAVANGLRSVAKGSVHDVSALFQKLALFNSLIWFFFLQPSLL